jgi:glutaredoxin
MNAFAKVVLALAVAAAVYFLDPESRNARLDGTLAANNVVVMYSLTTCPYCKKTRAWLTRNNVPFKEYFLDADEARNREFGELLMDKGAPPGGIGTPTLLVNDTLLLNNPSFGEIRRHLRFVGG